MAIRDYISSALALAIAPALFFYWTDPSNVHPVFFPLLFSAYLLAMLGYWATLSVWRIRRTPIWQYSVQIGTATGVFCVLWILGIFSATWLTLMVLARSGRQAMLYIRTSGQQFTEISVTTVLFLLVLCALPAGIVNLAIALGVRCHND